MIIKSMKSNFLFANVPDNILERSADVMQEMKVEGPGSELIKQGPRCCAQYSASSRAAC